MALRTAGGGSRGVRWYVDGRLQHSSRWALVRGSHHIRASDAAGESAEVGIEVQ
ncbi:MAG: hypothetical protein ABJC36_08800 [Gemmatimonadales bacterium]